MPIGNLTSQLFGNIYLNGFDHFVKTDLGIKYYGRYVDDCVLIHSNMEYLKLLIPKIKEYLFNELLLELHPKKIYLQHYKKGIKFLGAVIRPYRIYIANRTKGNFYIAMQRQNLIAQDHKPTFEEKLMFLSSLNSYLGIMKHYKTFNIRRSIAQKKLSGWWCNYVKTNKSITKFSIK